MSLDIIIYQHHRTPMEAVAEALRPLGVIYENGFDRFVVETPDGRIYVNHSRFDQPGEDAYGYLEDEDFEKVEAIVDTRHIYQLTSSNPNLLAEALPLFPAEKPAAASNCFDDILPFQQACIEAKRLGAEWFNFRA